MTDADSASVDALRAAAETMRTIRDRCVWTREIGHRDLVPYLIEETAELVEAIETGGRADLREELGDVLWQVVFHAEIASRDPDDPFDIDDVAADLTAKMTRRHPHVFGGETAETPDDVRVLWTAAKAREKSERTSVLDGVSDGMPSLAYAQKVLGRADGLGMPAPSAGEITGESELGDALLALVARARREGWDAERALRDRVRRLADDVRERERPHGSTETSPPT